MYDGVKIECKVTDPHKWRKLQMIGRHAEQTGEILPLNSEAQNAALTFAVIPTLTGRRYTIQGSLHRHYNHGRENDNDYTLEQVHETINQLRENYAIDPRYSKVINFEFGVNIKLPPGMLAADFNKYLVSAYSKAFEKLNPKRPQIGYIAEFNEYSIKVYDKGYQAKNGAEDQIRIEIKVQRTRWLDQFGFIKGNELYIADLLNKQNIITLGDILINKIRSLILTPREIDLKKLTQKQVQTFYECRDARSWEDWDSKKRERKRNQLQQIFEKVGQPNPVTVLEQLVADKWQELTNYTPAAREPQERKKATKSILIVTGIRDILLRIHEWLLRLFSAPSINKQKFIIHKPRSLPPRLSPPETIKGFSRWIDLQCRSPSP